MIGRALHHEQLAAWCALRTSSHARTCKSRRRVRGHHGRPWHRLCRWQRWARPCRRSDPAAASLQCVGQDHIFLLVIDDKLNFMLLACFVARRPVPWHAALIRPASMASSPSAAPRSTPTRWSCEQVRTGGGTRAPTTSSSAGDRASNSASMKRQRARELAHRGRARAGGVERAAAHTILKQADGNE